jgi:ADP-heptose:LPS heptosyltransferase
MIHHLTKILYIQLISFGDVIVSTAIIKKLKEKYPNSQIDYYTSSPCKELLENNPCINKIYTERFPPTNVDQYDVVFRPYRCLQMSGGWHLNNKHFMDLYAEACGVNLQGDYFTYFYNIAEKNIISGKYILIQCKTNDDTKDWGRFSEFVKLINNKLKIKVYQIGGKNDPIIEGAENLLGKTSWSVTAKLIKEAITTICLDSAVQHLAGAINAPYIALYGAKEPILVNSGGMNEEMGQHQIRVIPNDLNGCEKACYLAVCSNTKGKCINNINPEDILTLIDRRLS